MNKELVKQTLRTSGWLEIQKMFKDEAYSLRMAKNINTERSYQDIAVEAIGKAYACRLIDRVLKKIEMLSKEQFTREKESFK